MLNGPLSFRGKNLAATQLPDVEAVDDRPTFGADLGAANIQGQFGQGLGDRIKQADTVFGFDLNDGAGVGGIVVERG